MRVTIKNGEKILTVEAKKGEKLMDVLSRNGVSISAACGGKCLCGKCLVTVEGEVSPVDANERRFITPEMEEKGLRLACACMVMGDVTADIPTGRSKILIEGVNGNIDFAPMFAAREITVSQPTLKDNVCDIERVKSALGVNKIRLTAAKKLPEVMRSAEKIHCIVKEDTIWNVTDKKTAVYGAAIDIGTTTVAGYLVDLADGSTVATASMLNPQRNYGADVISRAEYTMENANGLEELNKCIVKGVSELIDSMLEETGAEKDSIYQISIVGNTVMTHLFADMPVKYIAQMPFVPVYTQMFEEDALKMGLDFPNAVITMGSCSAGYVGADTIAAALACDMDVSDKKMLLLDIGTNGEIVLKTDVGMFCCAAAAGPAFEGAHIHNGSGAIEGAIDSVFIDGDEVKITTIGNKKAKSICGSGVVSAVSELLKNEIIDETGYLEDDFELSEGVCITPKDIREVQLAKSAIAAGIQILADTAGIDIDEIDEVCLAGGFGNYIDKDAACNIGLIPDQLRDRIRSVGNAAGSGAKEIILSVNAKERAENIRKEMKYVELSASKEFQNLFAENMLFE